MINMHDIKKNAAVLVDGQPYFVVDFTRAGTGQRRPVLHVKLRHIVTGSLTQKTLSEKDVLEEPEVEKRTANLSYRSPGSITFMDTKTYEQFELKPEFVGAAADLLTEDTEIRVLLLDGIAVGVEVPPSITLEVTETTDSQKGAPSSRSSNVGKPAKLSAGIEIEVPHFIKVGDRIRVNSETREYLGKE